MENQDKLTPIRFYKRFWTGDFADLPLLVQDHLGHFLEDLARDPEDRELLKKCQRARTKPDYWAYLVCGEYVLSWRLIRQEPGLYIELSPKVIRIDVLDLRKYSEILTETDLRA